MHTCAAPERRTGEEGFALVAALLISMAVLTLSLTAVAVSLHNEFSSAYDRSHTQSIDAAEAGVDYVNYLLQSSPPSALPCSKSGNLSDGLAASWSATISYYASYPPSGSPLACPLTGTTQPAGAVVTSVGTAPGSSSFANQRTMQEQVQLTPVYGGFTDAVFAYQLSSSLGNGNNSNNFTITAIGQGSNDANIYANQAWSCGKNSVIYGSVYSQSPITVGNNCTVKGTVWANGNVVLNNNSIVGVDALSTGNLSMGNGASIGRNATLAGTCSGCTTGPGGNVGGALTQHASVSAPPTQALPTVTFSASSWQAAGYTVKSYSGSNACTNAQSDLTAGFGAQPTVVRITSSCSLNMPNMALSASLAVVSDGQIVLGNQASFSSSNATPPELMFIIPSTDSCSSITAPSIYATNNLSFSGVDFLLFTPCDIQMKNGFTSSNGAAGQLYAGGNLNPGNNLSFNFAPVLVPGAGQVTGYSVNTAYLREIANGSS
jgi:hypothetical protein